MKQKNVFSIIAMLLVVFMFGCKKDPVVPPTVTSTNPINNATGVTLSHTVAIKFSEPMNQVSVTSLTLSLKQGSALISGAVTYADSTATFTPTSAMAPNSLFTATVTTGVKNVAGEGILSNLVFSFTTGAAPDIIAPSVTLIDPSNNATGVALNKAVVLTLIEAMDPLTINATTFTLKQGTTVVPGAVTYAGTTATLTPTSILEYSKIYTVTLTTGAKDVAGNALAVNNTFSFTTINAPDLTPPTVSSTSPVNSTTGVAINKVATFTFSESMDPTTITATTFTLKQGTAVIAGSVTYSGVVASFTPSGNLEYSKVYSATITTGAKDLSGNALAVNNTFSFTTVAAPDLTAPTVLSMDPVNNDTGIALNKVVLVTFSEALDPLTINATTFTLKQGTTVVLGSVTYSGVVATFTPANSLENNKVYTVTVTTGAKDLAGNALASNNTFTFTTVALADIIAPTVLSTNPLNNATAVVLNKVVSANFSEALDPLTVTASTFTLKQGTTSISGTVNYSGTTATFTASNVLLASTVYTATLTTGVKDVAGNALASNTVWSFTTASAPVGLAPVNLGTAGDYVILAKTAINNSAISSVTGDMGLSPAATSYMTGWALTNATGYATSSQVTGSLYAADMAPPAGINLTTAVENMITAYNDAAGRALPNFLELGTGNLGGMTLTPGLYKFTNTVTMPSNVTISGSATDVWIFQIAGDLSVSNGVSITLIGGALPKNVFFQVAGQATMGTTSHFEGIILSMTGITFQTGASLKGRALAQTAVVLDASTIVKPF